MRRFKHQDIESYLSGKLASADAVHLERCLTEDPEFAAEVGLVRWLSAIEFDNPLPADIEPSETTGHYALTQENDQAIVEDYNLRGVVLAEIDIPVLTVHYDREAESERAIIVKFRSASETLTAVVPFQFDLPEQDEEDIRWYLEEFLKFPHDPAQAIADRVEKRIVSLGRTLFRCLFEGTDSARKIWQLVSTHLPEIRIEISAESEAAQIPWELVREPKMDLVLALHVRDFVRVRPSADSKARRDSSEVLPVRVLMVVARPQLDQDIPFRSIASEVVRSLSNDRSFSLEVLRPPSFEHLANVLRNAKRKGAPYDIVHFDGHGVYFDPSRAEESQRTENERYALVAKPQPGKHGYLVFELPQDTNNCLLVDGNSLGKLLAETGTKAAILNACRSAHSEPRESPFKLTSKQMVEASVEQARAVESLAGEVLKAGIPGVIAMRYNVLLATAAKYMATLYTQLKLGGTLGEAATTARKQLAESPDRICTEDVSRFEDWFVPVVYENHPLHIRYNAGRLEADLELQRPDAKRPTSDSPKIDPRLPKAPDPGFLGRDETLLSIDRAFDAESVVLLHGLAGAGKTAAVAEFARWYAGTGTQVALVMYSTFESHMPLERLLDCVGVFFSDVLLNSHLHWPSLSTEQRRDVTLQILSEVPILWIWDNIEPITGFPTDLTSEWSDDERSELSDFLRDARNTKARFILISRRDERRWLGNLPIRLEIPRMLMFERFQLVAAIGRKFGRRLANPAVWIPLLTFSDGNPLTLTVLTTQAMRMRLDTNEAVEAFVNAVSSGTISFDEDEVQGRSASLAASLRYGFDNAFTHTQRYLLALLHLFRGFVDAADFESICDHENECSIPQLREMTFDDVTATLDLAVEIGVLAKTGHQYYSIHPVLPWFLKKLFNDLYPDHAYSDAPTARDAKLAFVESFGRFCYYASSQYAHGNRDMLALQQAEEPNLLGAYRVATAHEWWDAAIGIASGLKNIFVQSKRVGEWSTLVDELVDVVTNRETDLAKPSLGHQWYAVTGFRIELAELRRDWNEASRLLHLLEAEDQRVCKAYVEVPYDELGTDARTALHSRQVTLDRLGHVERSRAAGTGHQYHEEAYTIARQIRDAAAAAACAFNVGQAYSDENYSEAKTWFQRSLELHTSQDNLGRARCIGALANLELQRIEDSQARRSTSDTVDISTIAKMYQEAISLTPGSHYRDLAGFHHMLGVALGTHSGETQEALMHCNLSIQYNEGIGEHFGAASTRLCMSQFLAMRSRLHDAMLYAEAAIKGFRMYGAHAARELQTAKSTLTALKSLSSANAIPALHAPRPSAPNDRDDLHSTHPRIGRNSPCPCGSGRKYKKCCSRRKR